MEGRIFLSGEAWLSPGEKGVLDGIPAKGSPQEDPCTPSEARVPGLLVSNQAPGNHQAPPGPCHLVNCSKAGTMSFSALYLPVPSMGGKHMLTEFLANDL